MIWGWEGSYERKGELFLGENCLRASTFKGASQCAARTPHKPEEEYLDVCLVVQAVDRAWFWLSTPSTRMCDARGQWVRKEAKNTISIGKATRWGSVRSSPLLLPPSVYGLMFREKRGGGWRKLDLGYVTNKERVSKGGPTLSSVPS